MAITLKQESPRRAFLQTASAAAVTGAFLALPTVASAEIVVPPQITEYAFPENWGLSFKYEEDAAKVTEHMIVATGMAKGANKMEDYGKNLKKEMTDFVR